MRGAVEVIRTAPGATPVLLCLSPDGGLDGWTGRLAATGAFLALDAGTLEAAADLARSCRPDLLILGPGATVDDALAQEPALRASPLGRLPIVAVQGSLGGPHPDGFEDILPGDLDVAATAIRLRAVLRRARPEALTSRLLWGDLELRQDERRVLAGGHPLHLSFQEFNLLALLMEEPERTWSRDGLCTALLGACRMVDPKSLNRVIQSVRQRLKPLLGRDVIEAVPGEGYRLI